LTPSAWNRDAHGGLDLSKMDSFLPETCDTHRAGVNSTRRLWASGQSAAIDY